MVRAATVVAGMATAHAQCVRRVLGSASSCIRCLRHRYAQHGDIRSARSVVACDPEMTHSKKGQNIRDESN